MPVWVIAETDAPRSAEDALKAQGVEVLRVEGSRRSARPRERAQAHRPARHHAADGRRRSHACVRLCLPPISLTRQIFFHSAKIVGSDGIDALDATAEAATYAAAKGGKKRNWWAPIGNNCTNAGDLMFTGIISDLGEVIDVEEKAEGLRRLRIACGYDPDTIDIGASIACSGICLTVVERGRTRKSVVLCRRRRGRDPAHDYRRDLAARHPPQPRTVAPAR